MDKKLFKRFAYNQLNEAIAVWLGYTQDDYEYWKDAKGKPLYGDSPLPQWDSDKNLWVEGSEVVKAMIKENLVVPFAERICGDLLFDDAKLFAPAHDYARALVDIIKESK